MDPRIPPSEVKNLDLTPEDKYFLHNETMRSKFNEVELDSFMKLLNITPHQQWEDTSIHHYKVGTVTYEDDGQETDPYFHLMAEVEREHLTKLQALNRRRGSEVKIMGDPRKRPNFSKR